MPPYPTLQLALSDKNPDHIKIIKFMETIKNKKHGYKSALLEKALLMYIDHQEIRGDDSPEFWKPINGRENQTIVLEKQKVRQELDG